MRSSRSACSQAASNEPQVLATLGIAFPPVAGLIGALSTLPFGFRVPTQQTQFGASRSSLGALARMNSRLSRLARMAGSAPFGMRGVPVIAGLPPAGRRTASAGPQGHHLATSRGLVLSTSPAADRPAMFRD